MKQARRAASQVRKRKWVQLLPGGSLDVVQVVAHEEEKRVPQHSMSSVPYNSL